MVRDAKALADLLRALQQAGAHNWNLVSPTPWWPWIEASLKRLQQDGVRLPIVYNTSGFESVLTLERYAEWFDVALIDLRYARAETAMDGSDCADYVDQARRALTWFWQRLGPLRLSAEGIAQRGVICRILVLPGHEDEAMRNLRWLRDTVGTEIAVSLMSQYTPLYRATQAPWNRRIDPAGYERVLDVLEQMQFENGWTQPCGEAAPETLLGCRMSPDPAAKPTRTKGHPTDERTQ